MQIRTRRTWDSQGSYFTAKLFFRALDTIVNMSVFNSPLIWENSWHLTASSLVSPRDDFWRTTEKFTYWWRVTTQIWVVFLIGRKKISLAIRPVGSNSQLWVVTRHQYGISALVPQTSFRWKTRGSFAKCQLYCQANSLSVARLYCY